MGCGSNTTTTTSGPPPQVLQAYQGVTDQAKNVAGQPLQQYPGPLVAGFTPDQLQAFGTIRGAQGVQQPYLNNAGTLLANSATGSASNLDALSQAMPGNTAGFTTPALGNASSVAGTIAPSVFSGSAPFTSAALGNASSVAGTIAPNVFNSVNRYTDSATRGINLPGYDSLSTYFNPYQQQVTAATQGLINEQNAEQLQQVRGNATLQNAYGGDREAVAEAETARQQALAGNSTLANIQQQGFAQAQGELNTQQQIEQARQAAERQFALGSGQLNLGAGTAAGQLALGAGGLENAAGQLNLGAGTAAGQLALGAGGLENAAGQVYLGGTNQAIQAGSAAGWLNQGAGYGLANLGNEALSTALTGANAQYGAGAQQQGLAQQNLNIPYEMFTQQQAFPYQSTNYLSNIIEGIGGASGGISSTTAPPPSALGQIAGLGTAGAGLFGLGQQQGWFGGGSGVVPTDSPVSMAGNFGSFENRGGRIMRADGGPLPTPGMETPADKIKRLIDLEHRNLGDQFDTGTGTGKSFEDLAKNPPIPLRANGGYVSRPHFANGGMSMVPDVSISFVPTDAAGGGRSPIFSGMMSPLRPVTSATQTSSPGIMGILGPVMDIAKIAGPFLRDGGRVGYAGGGNLEPMATKAPSSAPPATLESTQPTQNYAVVMDQQGYPIGMQGLAPGKTIPGAYSISLAKGLLQRPALPDSGGGGAAATPAGSTGDVTVNGIPNVDPAIANFFAPPDGGGGGYRGGVASHFDGGGNVPDLSKTYIPQTSSNPQHRITIPNPPQVQQQGDNSLKDIGSSVSSLEKLFKSSDTQDKALGGAVDLGGAWRGYDDGGLVQTSGQDMSGGANPLTAGMLQRYLQMPVEQLQEMATRARSQPNSPYNRILQQALQMKHMNPTAGQMQDPTGMPSAGMGAPSMPSMATPTLGSYWRGGRQHFAEGGDPIPEDDDTAFARSADPRVVADAERDAASQRIDALLSKYDSPRSPPKPSSDLAEGPPNIDDMKSRGLFSDDRRTFDEFPNPQTVIPPSHPSAREKLPEGDYGAAGLEPVRPEDQPLNGSLGSIMVDPYTGKRIGPPTTGEPRQSNLDTGSLGATIASLYRPYSMPESKRYETEPTTYQAPPSNGQVPQRGAADVHDEEPPAVDTSGLGVGMLEPESGLHATPPKPVAHRPVPLQQQSTAAGFGSESSPGQVYATGDSHGWGLIRQGGLSGTAAPHHNNPNADAEVGRSPLEEFNFITSRPDGYWNGKRVVLSTGLANDPSQIGYVPRQIEALRKAGANIVGIAGFTKVGAGGQDMTDSAAQVDKIAAANNLPFSGIFQQNIRPNDPVHLTASGYGDVGAWFRGNSAGGEKSDHSNAGTLAPETQSPPTSIHLPYVAAGESERGSGLGSRYLSMGQMKQLLLDRGMPPEKAAIGAATMMAESHGDIYARNEKGEHSYGISQINADAHGPQAKSALGNPGAAADMMMKISNGGNDFSAWSMYKNGGYKQFLPEAMQSSGSPVGGGLGPRDIVNNEPNGNGGQTLQPVVNHDAAFANALHQVGQERGLGASPWLPVIAAGFGMLASRSPHPGVAIGEGGLQGVKALEAQYAQSNKNELTGIRAQAVENQARHYYDMAQHYIDSNARLTAKDREIADARAATVAVNLAKTEELIRQHGATNDLAAQRLSLIGQMNDLKTSTAHESYDTVDEKGNPGKVRITHNPDGSEKREFIPTGRADVVTADQRMKHIIDMAAKLYPGDPEGLQKAESDYNRFSQRQSPGLSALSPIVGATPEQIKAAPSGTFFRKPDGTIVQKP